MLRYYHIVASAGPPYFTSLLCRKVFKSNCRYINRLKRSIEERLRSIAPAPRRTHLTFLALPSLQPTLDSRRTILQLKFARSLFSFWIFFCSSWRTWTRTTEFTCTRTHTSPERTVSRPTSKSVTDTDHSCVTLLSAKRQRRCCCCYYVIVTVRCRPSENRSYRSKSKGCVSGHLHVLAFSHMAAVSPDASQLSLVVGMAVKLHSFTVRAMESLHADDNNGSSDINNNFWLGSLFISFWLTFFLFF